MIRILFLLFVTLSFFYKVFATELPYFDKKDLTPYWDQENKVKQQQTHSPATVSKFSLQNEKGKIITSQNFQGHISVVNFFFTQCGSVCPLLMQNLKKIRAHIPAEVHFYSISVTPDEDTPEQLLSYANIYSLTLNSWDLLTGKKSDVFNLARGVFKADKSLLDEQEKGNFEHSDNVYLVDENLHIRGIYAGLNQAALKLLEGDIQCLISQYKKC